MFVLIANLTLYYWSGIC